MSLNSAERGQIKMKQHSPAVQKALNSGRDLKRGDLDGLSEMKPKSLKQLAEENQENAGLKRLLLAMREQ